jgi:hypothetical protein
MVFIRRYTLPTLILNAIITLQYVCNLVSTESFLVVSVDVEYVGFNDLVFQTYEGAGAGMEVLVVCTSVYLQDTTQDPDVVLQSELVNSS